jgi:RNA polymerase sigma factor (sigma-70 family)
MSKVVPAHDVEALLAHAGWLSRFARHIAGDGFSEDAVQETWQAAMKNPPEAGRPVRPWLAAVLKNIVRRHLRTEGRRRHWEGEAAGTAADAGQGPELYARMELQRQLVEMVMALAEPYRATVILRYYEDRTAAEIAREFGVPAGTVRWRLKEALDRVRAGLDQQHGAQRWRVVLLGVPLATPLLKQPAIGGLLMSTKSKLGAATVGLLLVAAAAWWWGLGAGDRPGGAEADHRTSRSRAVAPALGSRLVAGPEGTQLTARLEPDPSGVLRLEGQVIDPAEAPVEGAVVAIDTSPPRAASTDANGVFVFTGLPPRSYRLEALAADLYAGPVETRLTPGAEPIVLRARKANRLEVEVQSAGAAPVAGARVELRSTLVWRADTDGNGLAVLTGVGPGARPLRVEAVGFAPAAEMIPTEPGMAVQKIQIRLGKGAAVSGRVLDPAGRAVAGARVWPRSSSQPFPVIDPAIDAVSTDGAGRFLIPALATGTYQLAASHPGFASTATAPLGIGAGGLKDVEIRLPAGGRVEGEVREVDGSPAVAVQVRIGALSRALPWNDAREVFTDRSGRFSLGGLPRRTVQVVAIGPRSASRMQAADLSAAESASVKLTLEQSGSIEGVVVDGKGEPIAEAQVSARGAAPADQPLLWDLRGGPMQVSDAAGRFRFTGLPEGPYHLRAARPDAPPDGWQLQPEVLAKTGQSDVRVLVRGDGTISGRALFPDGTAPPSFIVRIGPARSAPFAGKDGKFSLTAPAGSHELGISGAAFVSTRRPVTVEEGVDRDLGTVTLQRGRAVSGRVLAPDGKPVAGATVAAGWGLTGSGSTLYIPNESVGAQETTADAEGRYSFGGFDDRSLVVVAGMDGVGRSDAIGVPGGTGGASVDLTLKPTGSLEGRVTRDGQPFADTVVIASPRIERMNYFVTTGPDGHYALDTLPQGVFRLVVFLNRQKDLVFRTVKVAAGTRTRADIDATTGSHALTVKVEGEGSQAPSTPVPARVLVTSSALPFNEGDTFETIRERQAAHGGDTGAMYVRETRQGAATIEGMRAGGYTICAGALAREARVRCVTTEVNGRSEAIIRVPAPAVSRL